MDNPFGFRCFYEVIYNRQLPDHAYYEWLIPLYMIRDDFVPIQPEGLEDFWHYWDKAYYAQELHKYWSKWGKEPPEFGTDVIGTITKAFRGSTKTTTLTTAWVAFRIGHQPELAYLLIQVGDTISQDNAQQIADIIENTNEWKMSFPDVVPDPDIGWGAGGYEVKRKSWDYSEWRRLCAEKKGKDPSFVGLGYKSRSIIGKHPTGGIVIDDIHDENNTRSDRELSAVTSIVTGTILPTRVPGSWFAVIGTPWVRNDILDYLEKTGLFYSASTPVMRDDIPVWDEMFGLDTIEEHKKLAGDIEYARMYMLDLSAVEGRYLKREWLHMFSMENIKEDWPTIMAVDYASTEDKLKDKKRDYFALAVGRAMPNGSGIVLVDGYRGHVSQGEAQLKVEAFHRMYPTTQVVGVENVGKGEEFFTLLLRTSGVPITPLHPGRHNKGQRFQQGMAPLFQYNRAWVADTDHPFINKFKEEWVRWPLGEHDDTLDAVYWMLYVGMPHLFRAQPTAQHNPLTYYNSGKRKDNPISLGFGRT